MEAECNVKTELTLRNVRRNDARCTSTNFSSGYGNKTLATPHITRCGLLTLLVSFTCLAAAAAADPLVLKLTNLEGKQQWLTDYKGKTILIGRDGKLVTKHLGLVPKAQLAREIEGARSAHDLHVESAYKSI